MPARIANRGWAARGTVRRATLLGLVAALPLAIAPAQDADSCAGGRLEGLRIGGTAWGEDPKAGREELADRFEGYFLECGVVGVIENPGRREVFLWTETSPPRYAVKGWADGVPGGRLIGLGEWSDRPMIGAAVPLFSLWRALHRPQSFFSASTVRSDTETCELIVQQVPAGSSNIMSVATHLFKSGVFAGTTLHFEHPDGTVEPRGSLSVSGSLRAAPWLPSRLESRTMRGGAIWEGSAHFEVTESAAIDPATDCDKLFEELSSGMTELKEGQRYFGPKRGVMRMGPKGPERVERTDAPTATGWLRKNGAFLMVAAMIAILAVWLGRRGKRAVG